MVLLAVNLSIVVVMVYTAALPGTALCGDLHRFDALERIKAARNCMSGRQGCTAFNTSLHWSADKENIISIGGRTSPTQIIGRTRRHVQRITGCSQC